MNDAPATRVLYLIDSLEPAGAELSLLAMAPHMQSLGVDLEVGHFGAGVGLEPDFEALGVRVHRIARGRGLAGQTRAARSLVRERRPDLVHTTLFQADISGRLAAGSSRVPVVSSLVSTAYGPVHRSALGIPLWKLEAARALDMATARLVRRFHAISHSVAGEMAARLRLAYDRIDVVPRGRDPAALGTRDPDRRRRVRRDLDLEDGRPVLLIAARHERQKALDTAVEAFERILTERPDAILLIAGREGAATPLLDEQINRNGLGRAVRVLGRRDDVADLMVAADVLLFPSRWEGLGSVMIEALALELPIVASDIPVVREVLTDDDGTVLGSLVRVGDDDAMSAACLDALRGGSEPTSQGRAKFLRFYTARAAAEGVVEIYRRALER